MGAYYDTIAEQYQKVHELPHSLHIDAYTYFHLLGELTGKSILDLACGEGFYSRQFKQKGAAKVVGVDISEKMIKIARHEEVRKPPDIQYIVHDVLELGKIGSFDLVVASYLLNYSQTKEQLLRMCHNIFDNLKPSGRFISLNNNLEQPPEFYPKCKRYGFSKSISEPLQEGTPITLTFSINGREFSFDNYYLSQTYFPRIRKPLFPDFSYLQPIVLSWNIQLRRLPNYFGFRNWIEVLVPKSSVTHTTSQMLLLT